MSLVQLFLLLSCIVLGSVATFLITLSTSDDQGIISTSNNGKGVMPGSFDASKNKLLAVVIFLFVSCIVAINAISVRGSSNVATKFDETVADSSGTEASKVHSKNDKRGDIGSEGEDPLE